MSLCGLVVGAVMSVVAHGEPRYSFNFLCKEWIEREERRRERENSLPSLSLMTPLWLALLFLRISQLQTTRRGESKNNDGGDGRRQPRHAPSLW
jgi:hypothetical protein